MFIVPLFDGLIPPQARVLATIGVTRGLGDHELKVHDSNIYIKPFLSCCPEVEYGATYSLFPVYQ